MTTFKQGPTVRFYINHLLIFKMVDDTDRWRPPLGGGYLGLRQMAPLMAEYANLTVHHVKESNVEK